MRKRELGLGGVACLEVTAAAVEQAVHEQTVWTLLEACLEGLEDCDRLTDPRRTALKKSCQQVLETSAYKRECFLHETDIPDCCKREDPFICGGGA